MCTCDWSQYQKYEKDGVGASSAPSEEPMYVFERAHQRVIGKGGERAPLMVFVCCVLLKFSHNIQSPSSILVNAHSVR